MTTDIHNYEGKLEGAFKQLENSNISTRNKEMIKEFIRHCAIVEKLSVPRRLKLIQALNYLCCHYTKKNLDAFDMKELEKVIETIDARKDYSEWTKQSYRAILKKFFKWKAYGKECRTKKEYPEICSWITTNIPEKEKPKVKAGDLITKDEFDKMIKAATAVRDKAFIHLLYELGARIGEIGNLKIGDITMDKGNGCYDIDLQGKTGQRTPPVIKAFSHLTAWLNQHPDKDNKDAPLWIMQNGEKMSYFCLRAMVQRIAEKALTDKKGNTKRIYPHLFRHSRVTQAINDNELNETQAKVYFGWSPSSDMLSNYAHLTQGDVKKTMLRRNGILKDEVKDEDRFKPQICHVCKHPNSYESRFCVVCGKPLSLKIALEMENKRAIADEVMNSIMGGSKGLSVDAAIDEWLNQKIEAALISKINVKH